MADRILIIRLSALGDILHTLPALGAIRESMPEARIGWLVEEAGAALLRGHPMIDFLHVFPRKAMKTNRWEALRGPVRALIQELRAQRYDAAIDFQGLTKSAVWTWLSQANRRIGFAGEDAREISRLFYKETVRPADGLHVIRRNLSLLRPLGIEDSDVKFPVHLGAAAREKAAFLWGDNPLAPAPAKHLTRIVINPGAGWATKQWPAENYGLLARRLAEKAGARVAISWGPGEEGLRDAAIKAAGASYDMSAIPDAAGVYPLPATSFVELGAVIARSDLFVGGDTGPAHFAAALNVKTLSIFGASDPKRNGPWGFLDHAIQLDQPPCIPCWKTRCKWSEPLACLKNISVDRVFDQSLRLTEL